MLKRKLSAFFIYLLLSSNAAFATEGGGSIYPLGVENFTCCAVPPPGLYGIVFGQNYSADKVRGNDGQVVTPPTFKVTANAIVPRVIWVMPDTEIAGASVALHTIIPLVDLDVHVTPQTKQSKQGLGDITIGAALGWHHSDKLHTLAALDVYLPTGSYKQGDVANIGRNYWAIQPVLGISYIDLEGFNADIKAMWTYNLENNKTDYTSGQEIIIDYAMGWGFGNGWTAGIGGYIYQQITNDSQNGSTITDNKARTIAIGPSIRYNSGKGWFITGKYQTESKVRNKADGKSFLFKAVFPF